MSALTINGSPVHVTEWSITPDWGVETASEGIDRSVRSTATEAQPPGWVVEWAGAPIDRDDAKELEASLDSGSVTLDGDLLGKEVTADVHGLTRIEHERVPIYGAVRCTFWLHPEVEE